MKLQKVSAAIILVFLALGLSAQNGQRPPKGDDGNSPGPPPEGQSSQGRQGPHRPPPEALAACEGKTSGAACSFTGRQKETVTGTCFAPPAGGPDSSNAQESKPLACRPAHAAPRDPERGRVSDRPDSFPR